MNPQKLFAVAAMACLFGCAATLPGTTRADESSKTARRQIVAISDLHFGLGKDQDGRWDPREDFRWTNALKAFLAAAAEQGQDKVDLVIAGDFLELWQPPDGTRCDGNEDAACSLDQMREIIRHVVQQHDTDLKLLADFAKRGDNRLIVIPGNHDAAILMPEIWNIVAKPLDVASGRVTLVTSGIWTSADGQVVIEHGHQIGADVNAFPDWPNITKTSGGKPFVESPWGERFVQRLFNAEERSYPIIDNLSPESAGARLRLVDRGLWKSTKDLARFISFNIFETTLAQKLQVLSTDGTQQPTTCSQEEAKQLGYRLFSSALPPGDPFKAELEGNNPEAKALRTELGELAATLSPEEVAQICAQHPPPKALGGALQGTFVPRTSILRTHTHMRLKSFPRMTVFVYAHTHQLEPGWDLKLGLASSVKVLNTGAFQRLVDEEGFRRRVEVMKLTKESDGLSKIPLESLAACYSFVKVQAGDASARPIAETLLWRMAEGDNGGTIVSPRDASCK